MSTEEQIFNLIIAAEEQQKTTENTLTELSAVLEDIKTYDRSMRASHSFLTECVSSMQGSVSNVRSMFDKSLSDFKKVVVKTVDAAIEESSADASKTAADAIIKSFTPMLDTIERASLRADSSAAKLNESSQQLSVRRMFFMFGCVASMVFLGFGIIGWQRYEYQNLKDENTQLLQSNIKLRTNGALIKFNTCENRLCIETGSDQPVIYKSEDQSRSWIIPKGY
jgi:hypothetical protein